MSDYAYLGTDIAVDLSASVGDLDLVTGKNCLTQDIYLRLTTPRGDLWCHTDYGIDLYRFLHMEGTEINQLDFVQAIEEEIGKDPRIDIDTINVEIVSWTGYVAKVKVSFTALGETNPINLVLGYDLSTLSIEVLDNGRG